MLRLTDVSKRYGARPALEGVSLEVAPGEIVGLLGPNGAGKTSIMRIVCGVIPADAGSVTVDGAAAGSIRARRKIGYLPEAPTLYPEMRVARFVAFHARMRDVPRRDVGSRVADALERAGAGKLAGRRCGALSRGQRQAVGLAQALVHDPPLLVLDEPASGLDPVQSSRLRATLGDLKQDKAILLSTHLLGDVRGLCDRVVVVDSGRVLAADTPDVIASHAGGVLEQAFLNLLEGDEP